MATLNYNKRLANIQQRKFDYSLNESVISKSFSRADIPSDIKYLAESMKAIPKISTEKTIEAAVRVQNHLENAYDLRFSRAYRTQGSVMSNTHIKVSDFDFLAIIDQYHYLPPSIPLKSPYQGDPDDDIKQLRNQSVKILKGIYDEVDNTNEKCVSIFNKALYRKVDVVFAFWFNSERYQNTQNEYYRGVKFKSHQTQPDYPFMHIANVNTKGDATKESSRKGIRLLKTLKEDSEVEITNVKSFHLTTIMHSLPNEQLIASQGNDLHIAQQISGHLSMILGNDNVRKSIRSPNGIETPLQDDALLSDLSILKNDLDILIKDATSDLKNTNQQKFFSAY